MASRHERRLRMTERQIDIGVALGIGRLRTEDDRLDGAHFTVNGQRLVDFGSCSYLGLNRDPRLIEAASDAVARFGTGYSSSPMYSALGMYEVLEEKLSEMFGATAIIAPTTTLAHLGTLPVLAGPEDLMLMDQYSHASLQLTGDTLRGRGVTVESLPHNDVAALEARLEASHDQYNRVWYVADGVYSMFGDVAPVHEVRPLLERFENLFLYYDDAHGFGWQGLHGRGFVLNEVPWHDRMVVVAGFAKSFGTTGGVVAFGDPSLAKLVKYTGGPFTFSGPVQPASLGASIASADFHLSDAHRDRQQHLIERIEFVRGLLHEAGLTLGADETVPVWFVRIGNVEDVVIATRAILDDGYYVNPAGYPAVPRGSAGIRFTQTLHHTEQQLRGLVDSLERHVPAPEPHITIDLRTTVDEPVAANTPVGVD